MAKKPRWSPEQAAAIRDWVFQYGGDRASLERFLKQHPDFGRSLRSCEHWVALNRWQFVAPGRFTCERLRFPEFLTDEQKIQTKLLAETSLGSAAQYVAMVRRWRQDPPPPARDTRRRRSPDLTLQQLRYQNDPDYRAKRRAQSLEYYHRRKREAAS